MNIPQKFEGFRKNWETPKFISSSWGKIQKELRSPSKPFWVLVILVIINLIAVLLLGWEKFFSVFDSRWRFFFGVQVACFFIATLLVKKTKENRVVMNIVVWVIAGVVIAGFTFDHSGIRSWMEDGDVAEKAVPQAPAKRAETDEIKRKFNISPGECILYTFQFPGGDFSSRPQGVVRVKETTANGDTFTYTDGPNVRIVLNNVKPTKIEYCSVGESVKVVLREWRNNS